MPSRTTSYFATVPFQFENEPDVDKVLMYLDKHGALRTSQDGYHFVVEDHGSGYYLKDVPEDMEVHGEEIEDQSPTLLKKTITEGRVMLVQVGEYCSNVDEPGEKPDWVKIAQKIPTLILREVLADRMEAGKNDPKD